jgi:hypothetical protein
MFLISQILDTFLSGIYKNKIDISENANKDLKNLYFTIKDAYV